MKSFVSRNLLRVLAPLALLSINLTGCSQGFHAVTPPGFIELEEPGVYDYRATTADGLVIAARELDNPSQGELSFWTRAIENQLRKGEGYALLETRKIQSKDGVPGTELRFGQDQGNTPHLYYVALFATPSKLCLVEVGGTKDLIARNAARIDWAIAEFVVD
jgi:hypothetical protein